MTGNLSEKFEGKNRPKIQPVLTENLRAKPQQSKRYKYITLRLFLTLSLRSLSVSGALINDRSSPLLIAPDKAQNDRYAYSPLIHLIFIYSSPTIQTHILISHTEIFQMASTKTKTGKQLGELLQEQQEPFVLNVYLIEKGYLNRSLSSKIEGNVGCCNGNPIKLSSRSATSGINKSRKGFPSCSKVLRAIYNKFARSNGSQSTKSSDDKEEDQSSDTGNNDQEVVEIDRFSSASSTTVYNSCPEISDKDESPTSAALELANMGEEKVVADRLFLTPYNKQHNPISVLEQIPSEHAQLDVRTRQEESQTTFCKMIHPHKVTEDSILSTSLRELFFDSASEKPGSGASESMELLRQSRSPQFVKSKRMLQQTRQLLFDCVKEIMETHAKKERGHKHKKQFLGTEELGELLWEKIKAWSKQAGDDTNNIALLLSLDLFNSSEEWNDFDHEKRELGSEIGDAIAQDIMNEIVVESIEFLAS